jgi:hypothetical protein
VSSCMFRPVFLLLSSSFLVVCIFDV